MAVDLLARFRERYVAATAGVEEPDPLLVELDRYVVRLEVVHAVAAAIREDIRALHDDDPETGLCPICGTAEHEVGCTVVDLDHALLEVHRA